MTFRTIFAVALVAILFVSTTSAHILVYTTTMAGANENPPNASPGSGTSTVTVDTDLLTMRVVASFSGLTGNVSAAHIHCCTDPPANVGVATPTPSFPNFPHGGTSGSYDETFDLSLASSYNPSFINANGGNVGGAMNAFLLGLEQGRAYFNIHTTTFAGGEIRGFLVPEPTVAITLIVAAGLATLRRRKGNESTR